MSKNGHAPTLKVAREIRQQERREEKEPRRGERHKATQTVSAARVAGTAIGEAATQSDPASQAAILAGWRGREKNERHRN